MCPTLYHLNSADLQILKPTDLSVNLCSLLNSDGANEKYTIG